MSRIANPIILAKIYALNNYKRALFNRRSSEKNPNFNSSGEKDQLNVESMTKILLACYSTGA